MEVRRRILVGVDLGATNCRGAQEKDIDNHGVVVAACMAAAGPISDSSTAVVITNWPEGDQRVLISELPAKLFPRGCTRLANDMEAGAIGLVALHTQGKLGTAFRRLWKSGDESDTSIPSLAEGGAQNLVLAVGTGLGNAALSFRDGTAIVTPLEGGHSAMTACPPLSTNAAKERELFTFLSNLVWQGKYAPEWEDVLSGRGIAHVYDWLTQVDHTTSAELSAAKIVNMARTHNCSESKEALLTHYRMLARFSQVFTVNVQAKAVFWMGDNLVANLDLIDEMTEQLKQEFLQCSKPQWVDHCPIYVQTKKENFNTLGALYLAKLLTATSALVSC